MKLLITGGAGFIGSNFVHYMVEKHTNYEIVVLDSLTYASDIKNLDAIKDKIVFEKTDIRDQESLDRIFKQYKIDAVVHFAAESHVDNSISNPLIFTDVNVIGTHKLIECARQNWGEGSENKFVHVSTDEVYGELGDTGYFTEESMIQPNSPYSASKASSDMVVRAYNQTFNMNTNITRCSNNYGPYQHNEKLIPLMISKATQNQKLPVYGNGKNVRDWLFVTDHCSAIDKVLHAGVKGEVYNVGGHNEMTNIDVVKTILRILNKDESLIEYVSDRKGHDFRYAIDPSKIGRDLDWKPTVTFEEGIKKTVDWYLSNPEFFK